MGRSYFVEEAVGQYLSSLISKEKNLVTGLLIGQCSSQRDYILLAVRTPSKEEQSESPKVNHIQPRLSDLDEEWIAEHANQVIRMLPGGLLVLGVFIITSPELSKDAQTVLRKLVFSVEKSTMKSRLWRLMENDVSDRAALHLCSVTKKILCRTYDVHDAKAGLTDWAVQIEQCILLINGQVKEEDSELLEGQKKASRGTSQPYAQTLNVKVLMPLPQRPNDRSTARVQVCKGSINVRGVVKCRAYVHSNKPKVKEAIQALKRDILNTVSDRCEIFLEDLILNGALDGSDRPCHALPRRVFTPLAGSCVKLCDYMFGNESLSEIQEHILEMLDQNMHTEDFEISEELNTGTYPDMNKAFQMDGTDGELVKEIGKARPVLKVGANIGMVLAVAVALLSAAFSFHYFSN